MVVRKAKVEMGRKELATDAFLESLVFRPVLPPPWSWRRLALLFAWNIPYHIRRRL